MRLRVLDKRLFDNLTHGRTIRPSTIYMQSSLLAARRCHATHAGNIARRCRSGKWRRGGGDAASSHLSTVSLITCFFVFFVFCFSGWLSWNLIFWLSFISSAVFLPKLPPPLHPPASTLISRTVRNSFFIHLSYTQTHNLWSEKKNRLGGCMQASAFSSSYLCFPCSYESLFSACGPFM